MNNQNNQEHAQGALTPKQKQAAIVCVVCAIALIATVCITAVSVMGAIERANESQPDVGPSIYTGEDYVIDPNTNTSVLTETAAADESYLEETLFIGDSNTVRFYNNGLLDLQQFCAKEGLGVANAVTEAFVTFEDDSTLYTIPQAVAMMKPRRVVITLGTNDVTESMNTDAFIASYTSLLEAIKASYPHTDIIINTIPPIPQDHASYPDMSQEVIDTLNMKLAVLAQNLGCKFLNTAQALKGNNGYGVSSYYVSSDIHLKKDGLDAILDYYTTHVYTSDDRRPDTNGIPQRAQAFASNASTATPSPTSQKDKTYAANYFVDSSGGGTLSSGDETKKTNLTFDVKTGDTITVTAVPNEGFAFLKWSDDVKTPERTDKGRTDVTAIFTAVGITLHYSDEYTVGEKYTMTASVSGENVVATDVEWFVNNEKVATGASYSFLVQYDKSYEIYVSITYNETEIKSTAISLAAIAGSTVPNLLGDMTLEQAKAALEAAGLKLGEVTKEVGSSKIGMVIKQSVSAGTVTEKGAAIDVTVAVAATPSPSPTAKPTEAPTAVPTATPEPTPVVTLAPTPEVTQAPVETPAPDTTPTEPTT